MLAHQGVDVVHVPHQFNCGFQVEDIVPGNESATNVKPPWRDTLESGKNLKEKLVNNGELLPRAANVDTNVHRLAADLNMAIAKIHSSVLDQCADETWDIFMDQKDRLSLEVIQHIDHQELTILGLILVHLPHGGKGNAH